jgi:RND superfamily putative drug exporter
VPPADITEHALMGARARVLMDASADGLRRQQQRVAGAMTAGASEMPLHERLAALYAGALSALLLGDAAAAEALGPGALGPVRILVTFSEPDANSARNAPVLEAVSRATGQTLNIVSVAPPVFGDDNRSALLSAVLAVDPEDMRARQTIDWLRATLPTVPELDAVAGVRIDVGGPTALIKDFDDRVAETQLLVLVFVSVIAFVMLLISIRSVVLAL